MAIKINSVFPVLAMLDKERAFTFYKDILGAKIETYNEAEGLWWLVFNQQKIIIYLSNKEVTSKHTTLRFTVNNIKETVSELQNNNIAFFGNKNEHIVDFGSHYSAWFKDTEGNSLEITEIK